MRITKIKFENWRGFRGVSEYDLNDVRGISGRNGLGKSTFADAVSFVLCGCNAAGVTDFERRPVADKQPMRGGVYAVTLTVKNDGEVTTLTRGERDVETRKRGSVETTYRSEGIREVDGVPVSVAEFDATVAKYCNGQQVKGLTFADWIFGLPVNQRRAYLLGLVDGMERAQIEARASLESGNITTEFKEGETAAMFKKRVVARVSEMKKESASNTAKIEENFAQLTNVTAPTEEEVKTVNDELAAIKTAKASEEVTKHLAEINRLEKEKAEYIAKVKGDVDAKRMKLRKKRDEISYKLDDDRRALKMCERDIASATAQQADMSKKFDDARVTYAEARAALKEVPEAPLICPCCGQAIPDHLREEWQLKEIAKIREAKSSRLQLILENAERLKTNIASLNAEIERLNAKSEVLQKDIATGQKEIASLNAEIDAVGAELDMVEATDFVAERQDQIDSHRRQILRIEEAGASDEEEKKRRVAELQEKLQELQAAKAKADEDRKRQDRILILQEENKHIADEIASAEQKKMRAELYERLLAEGITDSVNAKFPAGIQWVFSEEQVNGGINDVAEAYVNGVNIRDINNAEKIKSKLAISVALQDAHGVNLPIFVDNAESVNDFPDYGDIRQIIALCVTNQEKLTLY